MQLHYQRSGHGDPIVLLHGLFGSFDNLGRLGRSLSADYDVIAIDLRNHGQSPWADIMNYDLMADDVAILIEQLQLPSVTLIGHSMGGKVAMVLAGTRPDLIKQLFIIDIAPVSYGIHIHQNIFTALSDVISSGVSDRQNVMARLSQKLPDPLVLFLLKSYKEGRWTFNFKAIKDNFNHLAGWKPIASTTIPIYFIKGGNSGYINESHYAKLYAQFPNAKIITVEDAGHNVHVEKPEEIIEIIKTILAESNKKRLLRKD